MLFLGVLDALECWSFGSFLSAKHLVVNKSIPIVNFRLERLEHLGEIGIEGGTWLLFFNERRVGVRLVTEVFL